MLKIHSAKGQRKTFNTCLSYLVVVLLFYGSAIYGYLLPAKTSNQDKFISLFYSVVTPMVNPLIYTLRNKEVKGALRRLLGKSAEGRENYHLPPLHLYKLFLILSGQVNMRSTDRSTSMLLTALSCWYMVNVISFFLRLKGFFF